MDFRNIMNGRQTQQYSVNVYSSFYAFCCIMFPIDMIFFLFCAFLCPSWSSSDLITADKEDIRGSEVA